MATQQLKTPRAPRTLSEALEQSKLQATTGAPSAFGTVMDSAVDVPVLKRRIRRTHGAGSVWKRGRRWWIQWRDGDERKSASFHSEDLARQMLEKVTLDVEVRRFEKKQALCREIEKSEEDVAQVKPADMEPKVNIEAAIGKVVVAMLLPHIQRIVEEALAPVLAVLPPRIISLKEAAMRYRIDQRTLQTRFPHACVKAGRRVLVDLSKLPAGARAKVASPGRMATESIPIIDNLDELWKDLPCG